MRASPELGELAADAAVDHRGEVRVRGGGVDQRREAGRVASSVVGERRDAVAHEEPGVVGKAGAGRRDVVHVDLADLDAVLASAGAAVITILIQLLPVKSSACARVRTWLPVTGCAGRRPRRRRTVRRIRRHLEVVVRGQAVDGRAGRILVVVRAAVVPADQDARRSGRQLDRDPRRRRGGGRSGVPAAVVVRAVHDARAARGKSRTPVRCVR